MFQGGMRESETRSDGVEESRDEDEVRCEKKKKIKVSTN